MATVRKELKKIENTIEIDKHDLTRSNAENCIQAPNVNTHNAQRDEHFRSADFFDVERSPFITFKSKRVIMLDAHHGQLIGDLTIRDTTKEVVLEGEYGGVNQTPWNTYSAGFHLQGKVNRKEIGRAHV